MAWSSSATQGVKMTDVTCHEPIFNTAGNYDDKAVEHLLAQNYQDDIDRRWASAFLGYPGSDE